MASSHDIVSDPFTITFIRVKATQLCRRSDFSRSDFDDLRQGMRLYLLKKAHHFDPDKGNLEAFVTNAINTWVAMHLRHRNCSKRCDELNAVSLENMTVECEGDVTSLGSVLLEDDGRRMTQAYPDSPTEQFELKEAIAGVMTKLDPDDRDLLLSIAEHGIRGTARMRGVSWRQITNARDRIREEFVKAGLSAD